MEIKVHKGDFHVTLCGSYVRSWIVESVQMLHTSSQLYERLILSQALYADFSLALPLPRPFLLIPWDSQIRNSVPLTSILISQHLCQVSGLFFTQSLTFFFGLCCERLPAASSPYNSCFDNIHTYMMIATSCQTSATPSDA